MNERIKELAEYCDFYVGNEHYDKTHEEKQRFFMEKFAELIIKECADWIDGQDESRCPWSRDLIRHFGVEE
jgi:hypothetical protein